MIDLLWMEDLYETSEGYVELRAIHSHGIEHPRRVFADDTESASRTLSAWDNDDGWNLYAAMATRRSREHGGMENLEQLRCLWIDYDLSEKATAERFWENVSAFPVTPSYVVDSGGGGWHCYWLLEEPVSLRERAEIEWVEGVTRGLQISFGSDPRVCDAARIMRVPGTRNFPDLKKRERGRVVGSCAVVDRTGGLYQPHDFDDWFARGRAAIDQARPKPTVTAPKQLPERVRSALESNRRARALFAHDPDALPAKTEDRSASSFDFHLMIELLKRGTLTKDEVISTALAARERAGCDLKQNRRDDYWERTYRSVLERSKKRTDEDQVVDPDADPAGWLRSVIRNPGRGTSIVPQKFSMKMDYSPRYPSGIDAIDSHDMGGLYGVTSVGGFKNVGKSVVMLGAALSASMDEEGAQSPWTVCYLDGENAENVWNRRVFTWYNAIGPTPESRIQEKLRHLHRYWVDAGVTMEDIVEWVCATVESHTERMLVVVDSIQTILTKMGGEGDRYWDLYRDFIIWMQDVRVRSLGRIAFLVASELNKGGELKGRTLEHSQDVGIILEGKRGENQVKLWVDKSRETQRPELGGYWAVDGRSFRLVKQEPGMEDDGTKPRSPRGERRPSGRDASAAGGDYEGIF